jgi:hypothetical protein
MAFKMKGSPMMRNYGIGKNTTFKQTDSDLKDYLMDERGFSQEDADEQIEEGSYTTSDKDFLAWYKKNRSKGGEDAGGGGKAGGEEEAMAAMSAMMGGGSETPMMLKGKQKNLDKNNNGRIDAEDFKMLKEKDTTMKMKHGDKKKKDKKKKDKKKPPLKGYGKKKKS